MNMHLLDRWKLSRYFTTFTIYVFSDFLSVDPYPYPRVACCGAVERQGVSKNFRVRL